jgi:hypothetical protein
MMLRGGCDGLVDHLRLGGGRVEKLGIGRDVWVSFLGPGGGIRIINSAALDTSFSGPRLGEDMTGELIVRLGS